MKKVRILAVAVIVAMSVGMSGLPASATHPSDGSRDATVIGNAIMADPAQLISASYTGLPPGDSDHAGVMQGAAALAGFPRSGADFGMISTGETNDADAPNDSGGHTTVLSSDPGIMKLESQDMTGLKIDFNAPALASPCLQVDVKLLSEEFPEYVDSQFNDFVTARLDNPAAPTLVVGPSGFQEPSAPGNFLLDELGAPLTINNNFLVSPGNASGTTYDGATPALRAQTPVTAGAHSVTFYVADVGDSILDTTVFIDNLRVIDQNPCPVATFGPSFQSKPKVKIKGNKVIFSGQIQPPAPGQQVLMTLFAKNSPFKKVAKKKATLNAQSQYKKKFKLPNAKRCMIKVLYKGDASHDPSTSKKKFKC